MKMVMAIIRPERLQCVKDGLKEKGINGITITHVTGHGEQMGLVFTTRVGEFIVDEIEKIKIESVVEDDQVQMVIDTIRAKAETGHPGDGGSSSSQCWSPTRSGLRRPNEIQGAWNPRKTFFQTISLFLPPVLVGCYLQTSV